MLLQCMPSHTTYTPVVPLQGISNDSWRCVMQELRLFTALGKGSWALNDPCEKKKKIFLETL